MGEGGGREENDQNLASPGVGSENLLLCLKTCLHAELAGECEKP